MSWLQKKFISQLSLNLEKFKLTGNNQKYNASFRCPYCGDSKKDKNKTRGNVYEADDGGIIFHCYNCSHSTSGVNLIKDVNYELYKQYRMELLRENGDTWDPKIEKTPVRRKDKYDPLKSLTKMSSLKFDHPAKKYIVDRAIPADTHWRLYYCKKFYSWVNSVIPGKFSDKVLKFDHPRLILPMIDSSGYVFGAQGRSFDPKDTHRYISIMFDDSHPKIFGMDVIDFHQKVYVVEGPIDSLFLHNAVAMAGVSSTLKVSNDFTIILDNEPRNKEIISRMDKYIHEDYNICVWPDYIKPKDINDMVMSGISKIQLKNIIDENTFSGTKALIRLKSWKKI